MSWGNHDTEAIRDKVGRNRIRESQVEKNHKDKAENLPISGVRLSFLSSDEIKEEAKIRSSNVTGIKANKSLVKAFEAMGYWTRFMIQERDK